MIPKKIHFCWYGNQTYPELLAKCIETWSQKLSGYEIIRWDESNTQFDNPWLEKALAQKKYAFVADYVRFRALYQFGGIYLDTDMLVLQPLDHLLHHSCFMGYEDHVHINTAILGCQPGHPLIRKILDRYTDYFQDRDFKVITSVVTPIIKEYTNGLDSTKINASENLTVYPPEYFYPVPYQEEYPLENLDKYKTTNTYTAHLWYKSWYDEFSYFSIQEFRKGFSILFKKLKSNPFRPPGYYKFLIYSLFSNYKKYLTRSK
ncbi:hypothetical protein LZF95_11320 [Algoriphagus sp. AGSA1]|uniref:glycosyltransferase n=1 Tax=Algoriphagus sp. AGSA1 TaxID=2907213 RepID=UPI001F310678|nr:glycosyltransferase [Algoriphagus sp. AGSA1]MCE7055266.1 hypothetical protein [Algoriphagus sp. AGSA1]